EACPTLFHRAVDQSGGGMTRALYHCGAGRACKEARRAGRTSLRTPADTVRAAKESFHHQIWPRNDHTAPMPAIGLDEIDGQCGPDPHDAHGHCWEERVRADRGNETIDSEPPGLLITHPHSAAAARHGHEGCLEAGAASRSRQRAVHFAAGDTRHPKVRRTNPPAE